MGLLHGTECATSLFLTSEMTVDYILIISASYCEGLPVLLPGRSIGVSSGAVSKSFWQQVPCEAQPVCCCMFCQRIQSLVNLTSQVDKTNKAQILS